MGRAVAQLTVFALLLASAATLPSKDDWDIYSFHINSTVTSRYATTVITSRVANRMNESKEIEFHVQIPKNAFISKFIMFIDGKAYDGVVKTKEQAQQQYTQAVSRGQSAGIVSSVGRTMEQFKTSVTVAAHKKVTFELTYEELLKRTLGKYELQIHARPMQPVKDFKVDVFIHEKTGISFIDVKGELSTNALANAITRTHTDKQAWVYFYPTEDQQKTCSNCGEHGLNGDLIIAYEVNRDSGIGEIKTSDGYFVHHFAPSNLVRIPKNVVFVIDQSGSMSGKKIQQTRTALVHILNDLVEDDFFGLITFDHDILHWKRELVRATSDNLQRAKSYARNIQSRGSTDINAAVLEGTRLLNAHTREGSASILILLTDGDPTSGETNPDNIQSNVRQAIAGKFPLYCLGFGFDVNFEFLEKMSLQNSGEARRIYEDSDADLQLKGFYEEVAVPLLTEVTMIYLGGTNLTQTNFSHYYNGSEIVVAGEITDNNIETFTPQVVAISKNRRVKFSNTSSLTVTETMPGGLLQRVWAYLTVKQLLEKELLLSGSERQEVKKEALELSLKYSFVTPLTSMVVTKPQGESTDVLHKPKEGETPNDRHSGLNIVAQSIPYLPGAVGAKIAGPQGYPDLSVSIGLSDDFDYDAVDDYAGRSIGFSVQHSFHSMSQGGHSRKADFGATMFDTEALLPTPPDVFSSIHDRASMPSTDLVPRPTFVPFSHRFLIKTETQSPSLCFDVSGAVLVKLLHRPSRELYVNGELDDVTNGGFQKIVIHLKTDLHIEFNGQGGIQVQKGQRVMHHTGQDLLTVGSATIIRRINEIDFAAEDIRIVFLIHFKDGKRFYWPVLRQRPSADDIEGILALKPAVYEEVQQNSVTKVKIEDQEFLATSSTAFDYSVASPVSVSCWLVSADAALQRSLNDFLVAKM
ncbi:inter-alpha-trypsin inhibitor heavy chain H4-like isoform X2 [Leuresthes tenuis]|uniref:inter-alpha-trypsin inhibitor heavy chain H4-like isoform X2 n=1 Tax=Leuresthes tenuis TaxID=355514 RepID=UPI003B503717